MISLTTNTKDDLKTIIVTSIIIYEDCVIELNNTYSSIFIVSSKITEDNILLSLCADKKSIGDVIKRGDYDKIENIIKTSFIDNIEIYNSISVTITPKIDDNIDGELEDIIYSDYKLDNICSDKYNYKDKYLINHNKIKVFNQPLKIKTIYDAVGLFKKFIVNDNCTKLIISFSVYIPSIDHTFILDLISDKMYTYGRTLISLIISRADINNINLKYKYDTIDECNKEKETIDDEIINFYKMAMVCFNRCMHISTEEIKIEAYSDIKLKL